MAKPEALYVHIPFCHHICHYCDFAKVYSDETLQDRYLEELQKELISKDANRPFQTVYIGGGSPSALSVKQLETLLDMLQPAMHLAKEVTIEVNPEDMTEEKMALLQHYGIQRLSIGVQTFNESLLKEIGRHHQNVHVARTIQLAKQYGIGRLSLDFIYGLPNQSLEDLRKDIQTLVHYPEIEHVSFYSLILEEHTVLYHRGVRSKDDDWLSDAFDVLIEELRRLGYHRYEVSNFARGKESQSLHNLVYWHNETYVGIGVGASGYIDHTRYDNTRSVHRYIQGIREYQSEDIDEATAMFETMMLSLRLVEGIDLSNFKQRHHHEVMEVYGDELQPFIDQGYLVLTDTHLYPTTKGMDILDTILRAL